MKKELTVWCFVAAILVTSCQPGAVFQMFNDSGRAVTVVSYDTVDQSAEYAIRRGVA